MKNLTLTILGVVLMLTVISGCQKNIYGCTDPSAANYNSGANISNGSCKYYSNVMFWTNVNEGVVTITINGQTGTITGYVSGGVPNCNNSVSATFSLIEGSYTYTATAPASAAYPSGYSITGTAQVVANVCQAYQL